MSAYSLTMGKDFTASVGLSLSVIGLEPTGVIITADGEPVFTGNISAGMKFSWDARDRFLVEIQRGSDVRLELQEESLPEVGANGRRVRLFISRSSIWVEEIETPDIVSSNATSP